MIARDETLSSLYEARRKLTDLIVAWAPDPCAGAEAKEQQVQALHQLILQRDHVNGAIDAVIEAAFESVASRELLAATQAVRAAADRLKEFGKNIDQVNAALKIADEVVAAAAKVVQLA